MGDDCTSRRRLGRVFRSTGERGDVARIGDDDSGDGTLGRWSHGPEKAVVGDERESMFKVRGGEGG